MGGPTPRKRPRKSPVNDPVYKVGYEEGYMNATKKSLDFLELKYLNPEMPTDTPEAKAILTLARELAQHLREA